MEPLCNAVLKAAWPTLKAGFKAVRSELSRSSAEDGTVANVGNLDDLLGEAMAVLAREAESPLQAAVVQLKGALARPDLFDRSTPRRWIATSLAQDSLLAAVRASLRGEDETAWVEQAMAHYRAMAEDEQDPQSEPDAELVAYVALDFLMRSLRRGLTPGDRLLAIKIDGLADKVERSNLPDTSDLVDERVRDLVSRMCQVRFFRSADTITTARQLTGLVADGRFRGATPGVKVHALAWCARVAAFVEPSEARAWLARAEALCSGSASVPAVLNIARAFVAALDDCSSAIAMLDAQASPAQATAVLQILRHSLGTDEALERAQRAGLNVTSLDSDGRFVLLAALVEARRWNEALEASRALDNADYEANPALLWIAASVLVASCLPVDLRPMVLHDMPSTVGTCPLREDPAALGLQRAARALVEVLAERCDALDLAREASAARRYALWLMLFDPGAKDATAILQQRFADPRDGLSYLPLALHFDLGVDPEAAATAIERRLALGGTPAPEIVNALIALVVDRAVHAPAAAAALIEKHRVILSDFVEPRSLISLEARVLVASGKHQAARALLAIAPHELGSAERALLEGLVEGTDAEPSLEALETSYLESPQPGTLVTLVRRYSENGFTPRYMELARTLLQQMPTTEFAEKIIGFLIEAERDEEAHELLDLVSALVAGSERLRTYAAWLHFRLGNLAAAEAALGTLETVRDDTDDRTLRLQLLVAGGRWDELDAWLERQWQARMVRTPMDLARYANFAAQIGSKRTADLAIAAVAAAPSDPEVLVAAYMAATSAGLEENISGASAWLMTAAELSGEDGPIKSAPLQELLVGREERQERSDAATRALVSGSAPLETIALLVSRSWLELHLAPLITNPAERDLRQRRLRAPFSGRNRIAPGETIPASTIAISADALVTLALLDTLDVLAAFEHVIVPHDLLANLFDQKNRLNFHQPSRIASARRLLQLVANDTVRPLRSTKMPDLALVTDIGLARAALLNEAVAHQDGQHVLIHPFPIRKVGSLLAEPAPLEGYSAHLASCSGVLAALERMGQVTAAEASQASAYFAQHEKAWPDEVEIQPGAVLYLSDLAIAYLRYTGLLERIPAAGLTVIVSDSELDEARALTANADLSDAVDRVLDRLRIAITAGLSDGRVILAPAPRSDELAEAQSEILAGLVARAPVLVSDDRFLNRHERFEHETGTSRILSSLDLLQMWANSAELDQDRLERARVELRRRGAAFVPVNAAELVAQVGRTRLATASSHVKDNAVSLQETGELRALRENLRLIQAHGWYDPLNDASWLADLQSALVEAIMAQFADEIPDELARARANWLVQQLDVRDWCESQVGHGLVGLAEMGLVLEQARMLGASFLLKGDAAARFARWFEDDVVRPAWAREPRLKPLLLEHLRDFVRSMAADLSTSDDQSLSAALVFNRLPEFLQLDMLGDTAFQDLVGYTFETRAEIGDATFIRSDFFDAVGQLYAAPAMALAIGDEQGRTWTLGTDPGNPHWPLLLMRDDIMLTLRGLPGRHPDAHVRNAMLEAVLAEKSIARSVLAFWHDRLAQGVLSQDDVEQLDKDLAALPPFVAEAIGASFETGKAPISLLVPDVRPYWEHLVGKSTVSTPGAFAEQGYCPAIWHSGEPIERAQWALLLAAHPLVLRQVDLGLDAGQWRALGEWALVQGDVLAQIGFVELALPRVADDPALEDIVLALVAKVESLDPADEGGSLHLFSSLAIFVEGELSRAGTLADWPPWRRRLAAMAHAALLARGTHGQADTARLSRFGIAQRGWRYVLQTLVDMRDEPRWRGENMSAVQFRHELTGRIVNAAAALSHERLTPGLKAALLAPQGSVRARLVVPLAMLPGPLEGAVNEELQGLPAEVLDALDTALAHEELGLGTVRQLINFEGLVRLPDAICERVVHKLRGAGASLLSALSPAEVHIHLLGLANLAASHRLSDLAVTVQELARLQRARARLDVGNDMQLALHAAAAHEGHEAWSRFLGNWITELAYSGLEGEEGERLLGWIDSLCEIDPRLRSWIGRARAAVRIMLGK